jgi:hypothetical protein
VVQSFIGKTCIESNNARQRSFSFFLKILPQTSRFRPHGRFFHNTSHPTGRRLYTSNNHVPEEKIYCTFKRITRDTTLDGFEYGLV